MIIKCVSEKINKLFNWLNIMGEVDDGIMDPEKIDDGYRTEIYLPLVRKVVIGLGETKLISIENAAIECEKYIDEYVNDHPEFGSKYDLQKTKYIFTETDDSLTLSITERDIIHLNDIN